MGFARTLSSQLQKVVFNPGNAAVLTTAAQDFTLGDITTPAYSGRPTYAFFDFICYTRKNTNVGENNVRNTSGARMELENPSAVTQTCGAWLDALMLTGPSAYAYGEYRVPGTTNIAAFLRPNTVYHVNLMQVKAGLNNLELDNNAIELSLIYI